MFWEIGWYFNPLLWHIFPLRLGKWKLFDLSGFLCNVVLLNLLEYEGIRCPTKEKTQWIHGSCWGRRRIHSTFVTLILRSYFVSTFSSGFFPFLRSTSWADTVSFNKYGEGKENTTMAIFWFLHYFKIALPHSHRWSVRLGIQIERGFCSLRSNMFTKEEYYACACPLFAAVDVFWCFLQFQISYNVPHKTVRLIF